MNGYRCTDCLEHYESAGPWPCSCHKELPFHDSCAQELQGGPPQTEDALGCPSFIMEEPVTMTQFAAEIKEE